MDKYNSQKIKCFDLIKTHFDNSTNTQLRGNSSIGGIYNYASFIQEKLKITEGKILDIGCGDGEIMKAIHRINPKLEIDGVELSENLSNMARVNNPNSKIFNVNALHLDVECKYDRIFSFSFAQYLKTNQLLELNLKLINFLQNKDSQVMHLSIPDWRMKHVLSYVDCIKNNKIHLMPFKLIKNFINFNRTYLNDGSCYHDPCELIDIHKEYFNSTISTDSDSYYRFDMNLSV